jgi:hypothetical protein
MLKRFLELFEEIDSYTDAFIAFEEMLEQI